MKGNFKAIINDTKPVLVDFFAEWCGPCKAMTPVLKDLSKEMDNVRIIKIDIDKNPKITKKYNVKSVPTLLLFKEGKNLWKQSGSFSLEQLKTVISEHLT